MQFWDQHKTITDYYELLAGRVCARYDLTQMEYDILMFLHSNPQHNTAADIVMIRKSTKSHVSVSLKSLERKGLIRRVQNKSNKKRIEITLTDTFRPYYRRRDASSGAVFQRRSERADSGGEGYLHQHLLQNP